VADLAGAAAMLSAPSTTSQSPSCGLHRAVSIAGWRVIAHGDFARTCSTVCDPIVSTRLGSRNIFFVTDPQLFFDASSVQHGAFSNRQDEGKGDGGIVGAVGADWKRRREVLRFIQSRDALISLAAPSIGLALREVNSLSNGHRPADMFLALPAQKLQWSKALLNRALHDVVLSARPPAPQPAPIKQRHRRLRTRIVRASRLPALSLLLEQVVAVARGVGFFELAQLYTSRSRKIERKATRLARVSSDAGRDAAHNWLDAQVRSRWKAARGETGSDSLVSKQAPPVDLLDALLRSTAPIERVGAGAATDAGPEASSCPLSTLAAPAPASEPTADLELEEVIGVLRDVLTAGTETTASTLSTAMSLLEIYPEVADQVLHEARTAGLQDPSDEALVAALSRPAALTYTRAVLMETARLFPAAPLLLRVANDDTTLGGRDVPAGSGIVTSTSQIGRDASCWDRPDDFIPGRFVPNDPAYRSAEASRAYLAFGAGPRSCIGQQLSLALATLALAHTVAAAGEAGHEF
jgi:cytochrome P450